MRCVGRSFLDREAIALKQEPQCVARLRTCLSVVKEEIKEVAILEVLFEVGLFIFACLLINGSQIHAFLVDLTSVNFLLDRTHGDQPVDYDITLLPYAEDTIHSLIVVGRVPIRVNDHSPICTCQIETETSDFCRKECAENGLVLVEVVTHLLTG